MQLARLKQIWCEMLWPSELLSCHKQRLAMRSHVLRAHAVRVSHGKKSARKFWREARQLQNRWCVHVCFVMRQRRGNHARFVISFVVWAISLARLRTLTLQPGASFRGGTCEACGIAQNHEAQGARECEVN